VDENRPLHKIATQVVRQAVYQSWFFLLPRRRKRSRSRCISLPPTPNFLYEERNNHKERVENPNAHDGFLVRQWIARHVRVTYLDHNERDSESDHSCFANRRHRISRQVKHDPDAKQPDFQCELRIPIIPQTETHFPRVVVDREITRMRDEVENPVRENSQAYNQSGVFPVEAAVSAADCLIRDSS